MVEDPIPSEPRRRRPPSPFRRVTVRRVEHLGARLMRVTLGGDELEGMGIADPAASVRVLLPEEDGEDVVIPEWNGNEFLRSDGSRPAIRTLTPARVDHGAHELEVWVVVHGAGRAARWASTARIGSTAAVSGPGRGFVVEAATPAWLLAGDETAIAAMTQLLEAIPPPRPVTVHVEAPAAGHGALLSRPGGAVTWHEPAPDGAPGDTLVDAVSGEALVDGVHVWAAGEAAAMQRMRRHLLDERGLLRAHCTVRGYWKAGRSAEGDDEG